MLAGARSFGRFTWGLGAFLRRTLTPEDCRRIARQQLRERTDTFLGVLEHGVFARPQSPYGRLCAHAGIAFEDIADWVRRDGVETALGRLYDAGVHLSFDEFKGRVPIERSGLAFRVDSEDFDNPLLDRVYRGQTGGSRGAGARVSIDLDLLTHDAAHNALAEDALGVGDRPRGQWRPAPPASAAMSDTLRSAKTGRPVERWFSQSRVELRRDTLKYDVFTVTVLAASRLYGNPLPWPEHTPLAEIGRVAGWLSEKRRAGTPALMSCPSSSAVRICRFAEQAGLDLAGTVFRVGGDPLTPAKAAIVEKAGCRVVSRYSLNELGNVGMPCGNPVVPDDVHVMSGKLALLQRERRVGDSGSGVAALVATTLLPASPKLMLNVDLGDYGVLEERDCGCPMAELGFGLHLHGVRSHEKLTSEGMTFSGDDLLRLIDQVLPARFGGDGADYQLVESEIDGLARVTVVVSPRVGPVDEDAVIESVIDSLGSQRAAWRMASERWRQAGTLRVERREPYATSAAKILPLHFSREP